MQKIKLCGMMKPCDIEYANRVKPDLVGFIFANTRRKISPAQAKQFREALDAEIPAVGVFVNEDISVITSLVQNGCIDMIQLHGEEDADYIRRLREICDVPVIKAVKVQMVEQIRQAAALPVDYLLLDTYRKGVLGRRRVVRKAVFLSGRASCGKPAGGSSTWKLRAGCKLRNRDRWKQGLYQDGRSYGTDEKILDVLCSVRSYYSLFTFLYSMY